MSSDNHNLDAETLETRKQAKFTQGIYVFLGLAALTLLEAGLVGASTIVMMLVGIAKAALIINYFMHISSVMATGRSMTDSWSEVAEDHS